MKRVNLFLKLRAFVVFIAWLLVLAVGAEVLARAVFRPLPRLGTFLAPVDDDRGYALRPLTNYLFTGVKESLPNPVLFQINEQGLRENRLITREVPSGKIRIATVGDSETFGWSVRAPETFQQVLEKMDDRLEVVNMGVPGYNVENVASHTELMLQEYSANAVLYWVNPNDFFPPKSAALLRYARYSHFEILYRCFYLVEALKDKREHDSLYSPDQIERMETGLMYLISECEAHEATPILLFSRPRDIKILESLPNSKEILPKSMVLDADSTINGYPRVDGHVSSTGHRKLAEFIYTSLLEDFLNGIPKVDR